MNVNRSSLVIEQGAFFPSAMRWLIVIVGVALSIVLIGLPILAMYSRGQVAMDLAEQNQDVTLVDATQRKKFLLKACDTELEARSLANNVAQFTGLPIERYAPKQLAERRR